MNARRLLALLVVLVLSIACVAPSAMAACPSHRGSPTSWSGVVDTGSLKGEGGNSTGDDDRWGDPNDNDAASEVHTDEDTTEDGEDAPEEDPDAKSTVFGRRSLWSLFGRLFVL